jgi:MoaA/NifB/PqqE/SkfB family radical SAM enzyme
VGIVERFRPFSVTICGGEPLLRRDALEIIARVKHAPGWRYVSIITNGWFLSESKAAQLLATGLDQINVSLNFPDERQDEDRRLPGLFARIAHIVPWLAARGANVQLNTVLMNDNLDDALPIAELARSWGAQVTYTLYSELPADNRAHLFPPERHARVAEVLQGLLAHRRAHRNIANTRWYFDLIPTYLGGTDIPGCTAGKETLHISPGGLVRPCAELPVTEHWSLYDPRRAAPVDCTRCFQACRGEVQAPITLARIVETLRG